MTSLIDKSTTMHHLLVDLDESLKNQLRIQAAELGRSMEEEICHILQQTVMKEESQKGLGSRIHQEVMAISGGFDLGLPKRAAPRPAPDC